MATAPRAPFPPNWSPPIFLWTVHTVCFTDLATWQASKMSDLLNACGTNRVRTMLNRVAPVQEMNLMYTLSSIVLENYTAPILLQFPECSTPK
ncbi:hypothetical protein Y032_0039g10 [Ancylostoma ceylanicum]|uniref:Uncharacterized protein n=1 Tax=Ancylostoma ceylanicum TaxID=53326 RepID=A0A016UIM0_9BILA|nr:hypothetical protein Y032_0039g10 [Ancylostoma ceylanicum]